MSRISRRTFLGGAAAGASLLAVGKLGPRPDEARAPAAASVPAPSGGEVVVDPRVAQLVELSRDTRGTVHVERVAFVDADGAVGTLPVTAREARDLRAVLASRDVAALQARGLRLGGHKFVFVRESDDGAVVHAVRRGEFVTVRRTPDHLVVATSGDGMAHGRAVEAVYQFVRRTAANA